MAETVAGGLVAGGMVAGGLVAGGLVADETEAEETAAAGTAASATAANGEQLRLMAVHAHPDDESSKGAATMARYVAEGVDVLVVTCTGGERGSVLNPKLDRYIG